MAIAAASSTSNSVAAPDPLRKTVNRGGHTALPTGATTNTEPICRLGGFGDLIDGQDFPVPALRRHAELRQNQVEQARIELASVEQPDRAALELRDAVDGAAPGRDQDDRVAAQERAGLPILGSGIAADQGESDIALVEGRCRPETVRLVDRPEAHARMLGFEELRQGLGCLPVLPAALRHRDIEREQAEQPMDERGDDSGGGDDAEGDDRRLRTPDHQCRADMSS
ncbi:hypothetical protein [Methylobacterium sp. J-077]|uniref:hypothetical protein n=1 Tax=Methylobacterium sp. J-077 TaxID=2836656 RepID=UPI001FBAA216|nr:hypothetical protein [Methylobacterium sp. J-077]MCJ2124191.1 hypothetical protein [Methylobacterium sp. J-077]